jgi:Na+/phosphate symporter
VERWFGLLTVKQIRRATHRSVRELEDAIRLYLARIARCGLRTSEAGH